MSDALVDALAQTAFTVVSELNRVGARHDLSLTQLRLIGILRDRRVGVTALAAHLGLEKSTTSGLLQRAERRGLVVRERSATDGRAVEFRLTADGQAAAATGADEVRTALTPLIEHLDPTERRQLTDLLTRVLPDL